MPKHIDEDTSVHPGPSPLESNRAREVGKRRPARSSVATALVPVLTSVHEIASFALECCERGVGLARTLRDAARAAASAAGGNTPAQRRSRRASVRAPASAIVEFSELDRQRARSALARANLHTVKRSS
jgi:hypothetical protein